MSPIKCMVILTSIALTLKFTKRVYTSRGIVRGFHVDYGANRKELFHGCAVIFLGIPFAQPPVGALRFKLPMAVDKYSDEEGQLNHNEILRSRCAQANETGKPGQPSSEDCLYLNVFTPNVTGRYPVMVWIHGGAHFKGGANDFHYKKFRVQWRGFFTTFTPEFPANLGLFDQILALRWVNEEISAFGGDPDRITLFGQSAGAMSISGLSLSPLTKGLFNRMILDSGSVLVSFFVPNDKRGSIQRIRAAQWCKIKDDPMSSETALAELRKCLSNLSTEEIVKDDVTLSHPGSLRWAPVRDGAVFPDDPEVLARSRPAYDALLLDMPVEQAMFAPAYKSGNVSTFGIRSLKKSLLNRHYGYLSDVQLKRMLDILMENYKTKEIDKNDHLEWFKLNMDIISAERYTNYGRLEAEWLKSQGSRVFLATFTYGERKQHTPMTSAICGSLLQNGKRHGWKGKLLPEIWQWPTILVETSGWPESGSDYKFMNFDDSLDQMSNNWRAMDHYVFTEAMPPVIGKNPSINLTQDVESLLKYYVYSTPGTNQSILALDNK
ncbi:hypothetical protein PRIPAC_82388 [Pristionchus pacificus]|uniref:Carboxylic ester hydrolase n=1 Tax=Pristionchus pacificus TaxID=54126 RepID=A0A2A6CPP5_PRIPA|nr:hypothetical protein PRIPAC_82388 [Pristionchus pacificus]|eukprot:PDM80011.1 hydrolase [Pristionchus pacificus]